jgi:predicted GNAT family acetyltransferase
VSESPERGSPFTVEWAPDRSRFEVFADGAPIGIAEYRIDPTGTQIEFTHTYVDPGARGTGAAEALIDHAVTSARARGLDVTASCWYVQEYLLDHR